MIQISLLEPQDLINPEDWCRPLTFCTMSGGLSDDYSFSTFLNTPENNTKWVKVKHVVGKPWFGHTIGEYTTKMENSSVPLEFVRGDIPESHQLDMKDYRSFND